MRRGSRAMDDKKKNEILAFFWFLTAILSLLSLLTYTPDDIPFETSLPNSPVQNFAGPAGAYIAWSLMLLFGKTSYFLVPIFLFWSVAKWSGKKAQKLWLKVFSCAIFFSSACALFSLAGNPMAVNRFQSGGLIGFFTSMFLLNIFGHASLFVAASLFLLSIILATELLVLQIATGLFSRIKESLLARRKTEEEKSGKAAQAKVAAELTAKLKEFKTRAAEKATPPGSLAGSSKKGQPASLKKEGDAENKIEPVPQTPKIRLSVPKPEPPKETPKKELKPEPELEPGSYQMPSLDLLETLPPPNPDKMKEDLEQSSRVLEDTLRDFGIDAKVVEVEQGPTIVRYELQPAAGVKVQKITALENDIALAMRATSVRIIAPIPGKARVGIEVPNRVAATVSLKEVLNSQQNRNETNKLAMAIGMDTAGEPLICNLAEMPHLLIAGATNTGKSVCINSIISSILFRCSPEDAKFLIIDPKMVELHFYNDLPHLICPVVTDKSKVPGALAWLVTEMETRYKILSRVGAKNIIAFNEKIEKKEINAKTLAENKADSEDPEPIIIKKMPYIVIVIDELADLMLAQAQEIEGAITRLAQLARAVGIHMILATQRPSVDVITGVIKANFPARIAFQVASKVDSRTILDENGADKLLGRGDFLLMDPRRSKLIRGQGAWVQDKEIERLTTFIKNQRKPVYQPAVMQSQEKRMTTQDFRRDEVYEQAKRVVIDNQQASVSMVQRKLGLGYTRAARLIDMMEEDGIVGPYRGAKPREVLVERPEPKMSDQEGT